MRGVIQPSGIRRFIIEVSLLSRCPLFEVRPSEHARLRVAFFAWCHSATRQQGVCDWSASLVSSSAPVLGNGKEVLGNALALSLEHVL